jgi:hypothetical protein
MCWMSARVERVLLNGDRLTYRQRYIEKPSEYALSEK